MPKKSELALFMYQEGARERRNILTNRKESMNEWEEKH
jgi:hypothetical protein